MGTCLKSLQEPIQQLEVQLRKQQVISVVVMFQNCVFAEVSHFCYTTWKKSSLYRLNKLYTVRYEGCMINRRNNPNYFVVLQRCSLLRSSFASCNEKHVCCSTATRRNAASSWTKSFSLTMKVVM